MGVFGKKKAPLKSKMEQVKTTPTRRDSALERQSTNEDAVRARAAKDAMATSLKKQQKNYTEDALARFPAYAKVKLDEGLLKFLADAQQKYNAENVEKLMGR